MKLLFSTLRYPDTPDAAIGFNEALRQSIVPEYGLEVVGGVKWVKGPGCFNLAFEVRGDVKNADRLGADVCMGLFPAKWCSTDDEIGAYDTYMGEHLTPTPTPTQTH